MSYEKYIGPIPEGLSVCHSCDNPPCINPKHRFLDTHAGNMKDMMEKGRHKPAFKGERNPSAKLTDTQREEIRKLWATGKYKQKEIGEMYGVVQATIWAILKK